MDNEKLITFRKSSASGSGSTNYWRILSINVKGSHSFICTPHQYCKVGHFSILWLVSLEKNDRLFMKISPETYLWTSKSPLMFVGHLDPDLDYGSLDCGFELDPPWRKSVLPARSCLEACGLA